MPGSNHDSAAPKLAPHRSIDVASQFPDALTNTELEQVTRRIERLLGSIEVIRGYPLENADEPATVFRPIGKEQP